VTDDLGEVCRVGVSSRPMDISCAFAPVPETPENIALAERLGYRRAWSSTRPPGSSMSGWGDQPKGPDIARELQAFAAMGGV
jgi:hypothetical protein